VPQSAILIADPSPVPLPEGISFTPSCHGLLDLLLAVSDNRSDQGRDHPVAVVLALVAAATVAGLKGYTAISGWVDDVPAEILDSLYTRGRCPSWPAAIAFDAVAGLHRHRRRRPGRGDRRVDRHPACRRRRTAFQQQRYTVTGTPGR